MSFFLECIYETIEVVQVLITECYLLNNTDFSSFKMLETLRNL